MATTDESEEHGTVDGEPHSISTLTTDADEKDLPPRASFMGLAVETRLQIYGYLLTPTLKKGEFAAVENWPQCCYCCHWNPTTSTRMRPTKNNNKEVTCECAGSHTHPQILRTSRQIFEEAMPVLYENMELRVCTFGDGDPGYLTELYDFLKQRLPEYALRHIMKVRMVNKLFLRHIDDDWQWHINLRQYCDVLREQLPKLRHIGMHLDCGRAAISLWALNLFGAFATLPELRSMRVCVCPRIYVPVAEAKIVQKKIIAAVERQAQAIGRTITIIEG